MVDAHGLSRGAQRTASTLIPRAPSEVGVVDLVADPAVSHSRSLSLSCMSFLVVPFSYQSYPFAQLLIKRPRVSSVRKSVCRVAEKMMKNIELEADLKFAGSSTAGWLAIVHFGSVGRLCGLFERSKAT